MDLDQVKQEFETLSVNASVIVAVLALIQEPLTRAQLSAYMLATAKNLGPYKGNRLDAAQEDLQNLLSKGLVVNTKAGAFACPNEVINPAIHAALKHGFFETICAHIKASSTFPKVVHGYVYVRNYEQCITGLRIALLSGRPPMETLAWLDAAKINSRIHQQRPILEICGQPFDPILFARVHVDMQGIVLGELFGEAIWHQSNGQALRLWLSERPFTLTAANEKLAIVAAEFCLWRGELDQASSLVKDYASPRAVALRSATKLLRGEHAEAIPEFELALKELRKLYGSGAYFGGICGFLYVLALIKENQAAKTKRAKTYIDVATRELQVEDTPFQYFLLIIFAREGILNADSERLKVEATTIPAKMFQSLVYYWLDIPRLKNAKAILTDAYKTAHDGGFDFVSSHIAELLAEMGDTQFAAAAAESRAKHGFANLVDWFEAQKLWQRQLAALANLAPSSRAAAGPNCRLAWMIEVLPEFGEVTIEPREQKLNSRGVWNAGRKVALKRLVEDEKSEFTDVQDRRVIASIRRESDHYGHTNFELDSDAALVALIGHPQVFWMDTPTVRVEILSGEPQLLVQAKKGGFKVSIQPPINIEFESVVYNKETPTRLRVTKITDEHRRIAAIVGDGMTVPNQAKQLVLDAIAAISSLVTVHSDVEGGAANVRQVEADTRLHAHLLPYEAGLKLQVLVRPFANAGPYFSPGSGPESVIAEIDGKPSQTHRGLAVERKAAKGLVAACPVLESVDEVHGEWLIDDPSTSLEMLVQLQAQGDKVVIAWPEGEKFKICRQFNSKKFSLSIKREQNWFAATGELQIAEDKVLDLRKLMELLKQSAGRFIPIGGNEFVALTDEFKRRLQDLDSFGDAHGAGVRVHPLAAFALEELVEDAGTLKVDRHWKEHKKRIHEADALQPTLPTTLQAELRDYQVTGFEWLARLAHWGGGACLADDMGLGKTLQALTLILSRAQQGPALVVAPTSVCMNWQAEAARFAPTLNLTLFGSGNRAQTLASLKPFDLIITSYGLLQQEVELFSGVQWHTIVLDEAQAIKNKDTKRAQAALALRGDFKIVATGTPLENHLGELWTLFHFTNPGLLGSLEQFNQRFAGPIERRQDAEARAQLRRLIQPFILRRTKSQVLAELPSRTEIVRQVDLSAEETALYEALRREALERLAAIDDAPGGQKHIKILAEIMKLRRACCHPQLVAPKLMLAGSKLAVFGELLDELLENRHKALVFSQFVDHLAIIRAYLDERGVGYQYLDGATPMATRRTRVDAFQAGEGDVFLISLKAGGTGLNLTAADYVIHMDPWWNPAVEDQASDRAHRMGQQRPVTIYRLVAKHTIEEKIVQMHQHKRDLADSLLGGGDISGKMSADAILKLLEEEFRE